MPRPQPADLWAELNDRQKIYLTAIYNADQNAEANHKGSAFDWGSGPPASEWRWQTFSIKAPREIAGRTAIQYELASKDEHDQGAGSSLAALRRRALIEVTEDYVETLLGPVPRVRVKLTTLGRATARAGLGHTAPTSPPRGLLSEWLWSNLVRLYRAGPDGMPSVSPRGTPYEERAPSEKARLFLERMDRKEGKFIEQRRVQNGEPYESRMHPGHMITPTEPRVFLTDAGRAHYERHLRCYAELYPDIEAPVPDQLPEDAHLGLESHKVHKPRGLLARPPYLLLVALVWADVNNHLWIRNEFHQAGGTNKTMADALAALPAGITHPRNVTRSATAPGKLLTFRGGPLAAETVVSPWLDPWRRTREGDLTILHLTDAGRAHYADHLETYRGLYDDVEAPDAPQEWRTVPAAP
ncbi:hypothetical protein AB0G49_13765 [Streptomyces longwoodensis]|uniref:hypothetical protein n=1 Tax=Streptomyces longwoodensis TaxID=68231 RepID=UPI0033CF671F